jgi:hypothetical protein
MLAKPLLISTLAAVLSVVTWSMPAAADPVAGAIVGGAIGAAAGGPPGAAIGAILGTAIGADVQYHEHGHGYTPPPHYGESYYAPPAPSYGPPVAYSYYAPAPVYYGPVARAYYPPRVVYAPPRYVYAPRRHYHYRDVPRQHAWRDHRGERWRQR